jgi:hypothetical protein
MGEYAAACKTNFLSSRRQSVRPREINEQFFFLAYRRCPGYFHCPSRGSPNMDKLYTIGHSNHAVERFVELLRMHNVAAVADVRSAPYSRYIPHFNKEPLQAALRAREIAYVFLGRELGARTEDRLCYVEGKVQFDRLSGTALFRQGLDRVREGVRSHRIALLCAEKDPVTCHRMILVCRHLRGDEIDIRHIHDDGRLESNREAERRLMQQLGVPETDLFMGEEELIQKAYDLQGAKIAYTEKNEE